MSKSKKSKKEFKDVCSPATSLKEQKFTCYTSESLERLRELWNKRHPDVKIKSSDPKEIWQSLRENMGNVCEKESCWLRQNFAKHDLTKELTQYTFAPQAPKEWSKNINEWLSSIDIEKVMQQYEQNYPSFAFLGPSPIDFDSLKLYGECVWEELCNFNLRTMMSKNKKKIGIVFNLDEHWKDGSHWTSMFIDVPSEQICYFDSGGDEPPIEVVKFKERVVSQGKGCGLNFKYQENSPVEHQMKDSECGVYCLYFISQMIKRANFKPFKGKRIPDKEMERYRRYFFRF